MTQIPIGATGMLGRSFSHYRIVEELGRGGMGIVYVAEDTLLGRHVAIKFPAASAAHRQRLLAEARAASSLTHPNIAAIYDCGELEDSLYVVMELVEGQSLGDLLAQGPLDVERSVEVVSQVAEALREAHGRHLIHRDVKPSNIRITQRGVVKVVDFGLAKILRESRAAAMMGASVAPTQTLQGTVSGTPRYMSPEQARGEGGDERSDLFSLGVVLYECLTGRAAFEGQTTMDALAQVLQLEPPPPSRVNPSVPRHLDRVTAKAMSKQPAQRYQSADELLAALKAGPAALRNRRRIPFRVAAAAALVAATLLALVWWLSGRSGYRPAPEALRWYTEGAGDIRDGTYYKATKALERAVALDPRYPLSHARLADAYNELDDTGRAQQELLKAISPSGAARLDRLDQLTLQAIYRTLTRDFSAAARNYHEILRRAPPADQPGFWLDLGRTWEKDQQPKEAIAAYQEAARRAPQYPAAFLRLGVLYGRGGDRRKAMVAFDQAASLYAALSNMEGAAEVLYQRAVLESQLGNLGQAGAWFDKALEMAASTGNQHQQIAAMLQLGELSYRQGDTAAAERRVQQAIELARTGGLELAATRGLISLGSSYFVRGQNPQAEKYFLQALEYARHWKADRSEARALLSLGSLHLQEARLAQGIREIEQALPFYRHGGYNKEVSQGLILLGRARRDQGDYAGALQAFAQQRELARKTGDAAQLALAEEGAGGVLYEQQRYPEALAHCREQVAISRSRGNQLALAYGLLQTGNVLRCLGHLQEQKAALAQAAQIANRPGGYAAVGRMIELQLAQTALIERQFAAARQHAAALLAGGLDAADAVEAQCVLGLAELGSGARAAGRRSCDQALEMARQRGMPRLQAQAQLCRAEASIENGDAGAAEAAARPVLEQSARAGQKYSEAQASLLMARAARAGVEDYARRAGEALAALEQSWSAEDRNSFESRPDIVYWRKQLKGLLH